MTNPIKQHQILFVDDETNFLETVRDLFVAWSKKNWQIECASSADQALQLLKTHTFDLVVVDVNMPVLDGIQFLSILQRRYPDLKKVAITGYASEERRSACLASGAELFIEKPRSPEGLKSIFVMLEELLTWTPREEGFQGMLRKVGLQDVIQMECLGRNSSILEVNDRKTTGKIYIEDGRIIHAVLGEATGEPAFQKLLSLTGGRFQLQPFEAPSQKTIDGQWEFLLMEAARVRDEIALQSPAPEPVEPEPPSLAERERALEQLSPRVLETLICSGSGDVLYASQCPDASSRRDFLKEISQTAAQLSQLLPLGKFDRLELQLSDSRAVAQTQPDRMVFVRVSAASPA